MIRSRTVRLAAIAVLGSAVLAGTTGCGGTREAGAAVVVGGDRVTDRQIQDRVAELQTFQAAHAADIAKIQQVAVASGYPTAGDPSRAQVKDVVDEALWTKAAALDGVTVTAQNDGKVVQDMTAAIPKNLASVQIVLPPNLSSTAMISIWVQGLGTDLVPSRVPAFVHVLALEQAVAAAEAAKIGPTTDPTTFTQPGALNTAVQQLLTRAAAQLSVKVSPRYATSVSLVSQALGMELASSTPAWVRPGTDQQAAVPAAPQGQPQQQQ